MQKWEDEHDMARVRSLPPSSRVRLKPNIFARTARLFYHRAWLIILCWLVVFSVLAAVVATQLTITPSPSLLRLSAQQAQQQAQLAAEFPETENTIAIRITDEQPVLARTMATTILNLLQNDPENVSLVAMPGQGPFYQRFGYFYFDKEALQAQVATAKHYQPLLQALQAAPNFMGFSAVLEQVDKALDRGKIASGMGNLLRPLDQSIRDTVNGTAQPVNWLQVVGLRPMTLTRNQVVVVRPQSGRTTELIAKLSQLLPELQSQSPSTMIETELPKHQQAQISQTEPRQLWVSLVLAGLGVVLISALLVRRLSTLLLLIATSLSGTFAGFNLAILLKLQLSLTSIAIYAVSCLSLLVFGLIYTQLPQHNWRKNQTLLTRVMLQAQKSGPVTLLALLLLLVLWGAWLPSPIILLSTIAAMMVPASLVSAISCFVLAPALKRFLPPQHRPQRLSKQANAWRKWLKKPPINYSRLALGGIILFGFIAGGLIASPTFFKSEKSTLAQNTLQVLAKDKNQATAILTQLEKEPAISAVLWAGTLLPPEVKEKQAILAELNNNQLAEIQKIANERPPEDYLKEMEPTLNSIASKVPLGSDLSQAVLSLRASLAILLTQTADLPVAAKNLEAQVFSGLNQLPAAFADLAQLPAPDPEQLDRPLRDFYISPGQGRWRLELIANPDYPMSDVIARLLAAGIVPAGENVTKVDLAKAITNQAALSLFFSLLICCSLIYAYFRDTKLIMTVGVSWLGSLSGAVLMGALLKLNFNILSLTALVSALPLLITMSIAAARQPRWANTLPIFYVAGLAGLATAIPLHLLSRGEITQFAQSFGLILASGLITQLLVTLPLSRRRIVM